MSSRDDILRAVRRNRPDAVPRPAPAVFPKPQPETLHAQFVEMIEQIRGVAVEARADAVNAAVAKQYPAAKQVVSTSPRVAGTADAKAITDPHGFADVDVFVCEGVVGVAESGAVWVPEAHLVHRALPFIAQHLVIVLHRDALVWNLHEAYAQLEVTAGGYGVFIAGPSKTADIEQSLVIGAHGARSLTVVLYAGEAGG